MPMPIQGDEHDHGHDGGLLGEEQVGLLDGPDAEQPVVEVAVAVAGEDDLPHHAHGDGPHDGGSIEAQREGVFSFSGLISQAKKRR